MLGSVAPEVAVVVCGHTHMPFCRLAHGRLVVNPGSVGMPYGRPGAQPAGWARTIAGGAAGWGHGPPQPHGRAAPGLPA
ncbi:MAG TPA: metallophosphoesterase family protein [Streptosporangiaceae bacterium]